MKFTKIFSHFCHMKNGLSKAAFFASIILITCVTFSYPRWNTAKTGATITWDVSGYYLYLPAFIIYEDAGELKFFEEVLKKYRPSPNFDQAYPIDNGNYIMKYSAGMAVLYLPSFLVGHFIASLTDYPADGFSAPYQGSLYLGSVLMAFLGLWIMRRNLLEFFSDKVTALVLIFIAFGSNYLNYASFDAAMPHNYLFTLYAFLIFSSIKFYRNPSYKTAALIGLIGGLAALARPTEVLMMLIPILWGLNKISKTAIEERVAFWKKHFPKIIAAIAVYGTIGLIQVFYWKLYSGNWLEYSYQDQGFSWLQPHFADVFFSYRKGWLIYTPIMVLIFPGFWFLYKKYKTLFYSSIIFFLLNTWVICAWDIWWYGGGFGQRAFIQSFPIIAFPIAAFTEFMLAKNWLKIGTGVFVIFCIWLNLFQTWQAHWGPFDTQFMTKAYYWRIFGKADIEERDQFLMDTKYDFIWERKNVRALFSTDFETPEYDTLKTTKANSGEKALFVNPQDEFSPNVKIPIPSSIGINKNSWLRATGAFYCNSKDWDVWRMNKLIVRLRKGDEIYKYYEIRPHRVMTQKKWKKIWIDVPFKGEAIDNIEIFLWNEHKRKDLVMDDLLVEIYEE